MIVAHTLNDEGLSMMGCFPAYFGTNVANELVGVGRETSLIFVCAYEARRHLAQSYSGFLQAEFRTLVRQWKSDVKNYSSSSDIAQHPAYREIVSLGMDAVPLILRELQRGPDHWFMALTEITGENPVLPEDRGRMARMASAWLAWGRGRALI